MKHVSAINDGKTAGKSVKFIIVLRRKHTSPFAGKYSLRKKRYKHGRSAKLDISSDNSQVLKSCTSGNETNDKLVSCKIVKFCFVYTSESN
jgi:hypothetical protein